MGEHSDRQQVPAFAARSGFNNKSTYLAALFTSVLALLLILVLWFYNPSYVPLLQNVDETTLSRVSTELQRNNIAYRYDSDTGSILVPEKSLYQAKFLLGSKDSGQGSVLKQLINSGSMEASSASRNNTGQFALESELAKTIASIDNIQWARVHLAIAKSESENRNNNSRASVFVRLMPGRGLGESQITSIAHLIASSAANLSVKNVTVIDQAGNLLKATDDALPHFKSSTEYSYTRILEQSYINKIENILNPIFGNNSVRVQVDADIDFGKQAQDKPRSEQQSKTIKKLTTTIVVDNKYVTSDDGQLVSIPRRKAELERIEKLVKDSVEFNEQRGDRVHVFNEAFGTAGTAGINNGGFFTVENKIYYLKVILIVLFGFVITYFVLRYMIQKFMDMKPLMLVPEAGGGDLGRISNSDTVDSGGTLDGQNDSPSVVSSYEALLSKTRKQIDNDPAHVAKVLRVWVRDNGR